MRLLPVLPNRLGPLTLPKSRLYHTWAYREAHGNLGRSGIRHMRSLRLRRAFFFSTTGYIGLAPETPEVGDLVSIFLGADVPFAVRKVSSEANEKGSDMFRFISECYVHGMMSGEAMQESTAGEVVDLTLV